MPNHAHFWAVLGAKDPQKLEQYNFNPRKAHVYADPRLWAYLARKSAAAFGLEASPRKKEKEKKVTQRVNFTPTPGRHRRSDLDQTWQCWWDPERNHPQQFSPQSVTNCGRGQGPKLLPSALLRLTPLKRPWHLEIPLVFWTNLENMNENNTYDAFNKILSRHICL